MKTLHHFLDRSQQQRGARAIARASSTAFGGTWFGGAVQPMNVLTMLQHPGEGSA